MSEENKLSDDEIFDRLLELVHLNADEEFWESHGMEKRFDSMKESIFALKEIWVNLGALRQRAKAGERLVHPANTIRRSHIAALNWVAADPAVLPLKRNGKSVSGILRAAMDAGWQMLQEQDQLIYGQG